MKPFENKVWLARPLMHGEEKEFIDVAFRENYITTAGTNIDELEKTVAEKIGVKYVVGLSSGTASLHMAVKIAALKVYGQPRQGEGALAGKKVFCSDMTFDATVNPVVYEGGEPVFIDTEYDTWNMDPVALEKAFEIYPDVKIIVIAHLYGFPAKIDEIRRIADSHGAVIVEDAAESMMAGYKGKMTGAWCADSGASVLSLNGNKIITASSGGLFLTDSKEDCEKVRKWSTQAREAAPWYEHEELGFNYRMSNILAGVARGQMLHVEEHIALKKAIYDRYKEGFKDLPVIMNPYDPEKATPNFWLSCILIDKEAMGEHVRSNRKALYSHIKGKSTPTEILDTLAKYNAEGRPIWKPMHLQPYYRNNPFVIRDGNGRAKTNAYIDGNAADVGADIFDRGLCLPSDINMTAEEQAGVIEIVRSCFFEDGGRFVISPEKRKIQFCPPDITEVEAEEVTKTLRSGWITTGPKTKLLERRLAAYIETGKTDIDTETDIDNWKERVVCLNSATAAEELNLRILGIKPGDEVIVPAYTYTATASAAIHCGATVRFVDIKKDGDPATHSPEMDYDAVEALINEKTKAIITMDFGGLLCDYERLFDIVERKKALFKPLDDRSDVLSDLGSRIQHAMGRIAIVEDAAHALGASRVINGKKQYAGAIADFTSFSFHAVKNFTTAEGGASSWKQIKGIDNHEIYKMFQLLSLHGQDKDAFAKTKLGEWEYDIIGPWYKYNMTDIAASMGLKQLDRYEGLLERRKEIIKRYDEVCDELGLIHIVHHMGDSESSYHLYVIRIPGISEEKRNSIIERLSEKGVPTNVHYKPLPMMTAYGKDCSGFPNAFDYYKNLITLPLHTLLSDGDVDYILNSLREVLTES